MAELDVLEMKTFCSGNMDFKFHPDHKNAPSGPTNIPSWPHTAPCWPQTAPSWL